MTTELKPIGRATPVEDERVASLLQAIVGEPTEADRDRGLEDADRGADDAPYDLAIPEPRAIDLRKLWTLADKTPDPMILAGLGPRFPVLLSHSVTAFPRDTRPPRVWAIRYETKLFSSGGISVDLQPTTQLLDVVSVGSEAEIAIGLGGKLEIPSGAKEALSAIPGVALNDAKVSASTAQSAKLTLKFTLSVPKVIAGPDSDAGARWILYAQDKRLEGSQALLQTVLLPEGATKIRTEILASVAAAGFFGRPKEWHYETASFEVSLTP